MRTSRPSRALRTTVLGLLALPVLPLAAPAQTTTSGSVCAQTAKAARHASLEELKAELWTVRAICLNLTDPAAAAVCLEEALEELDEAFELVQEQYQARLDLCDDLGPGPYDPVIDPEDFSAEVTNPYFPLTVGVTRVYEGMTEDGLERVEETTLDETREIMDVECAVVHAVEYLDGEKVEDTYDYYAQDDLGNVWYFGELSFELEDGYIVNMEGSFLAGEDGAKPGLIMLASAAPGLVYRQEWLLNEAEDIGTFLATGQSVTVPYQGGTTFTGCWQIQDTTPLEPDVLEDKFFAMGVGLVQELDVESGEHIDLVDILSD